MKKVLLTVLLVAVISAVFMAGGCTGEDKDYFKNVSAYSFWDNSGSEAIAQYKFYSIMDGFFKEGEIKDGSCIKDGKTRKILFLGWDGTRADAISNIMFDENNFGTNSYNYPHIEFSGLNKLASEGGIYLAYAGGEKGKDSEQETSTCAGWTSELTGSWHTEHGVNHNDDVKRDSADTIMLKYAKLGLNTSLAFEWGQYFDITLRNEVKYILEHPETPVLYRDIDRTRANSETDIMANENLKKAKEINAVNLDYYNAVAMDGEIHGYEAYDVAMRDYLLGRIEAGDDFVGGIMHAPDTTGHTDGFGNDNCHYVNAVRNADVYLYTLIEAVQRREAELNEEWLIIATADHGGNKTGHGKQIYEHRTIWIASNRPIDGIYFGVNYNGYKENP